MKEPLRAPLNDMTALLEKIQVTDCIDGDITDSLQIVSEKSISTVFPARYQMRLQVSNSAGDTLDMPVTVELYSSSDRSDPAVQLTDYLVYVKKGKKVNPLSYLKQLNIYPDVYVWNPDKKEFVQKIPEDGDEGISDDAAASISADMIEIDNPVDTSVPGTYEIQYTFRNYDKMEESSVYLIVVVEGQEDK